MSDATKINPLVRLVKMKRSGAHGKTTKAKRALEKVKFKREINKVPVTER